MGYYNKFQNLLIKPRQATVAFMGDYEMSGSGATWTQTNIPIGAETANRLVVVCVKGKRDAGGTISAATIGGVAATVVEGASVSGGSEFIIQAVVPTGTTATVSITWSIAQVGCLCAVYVLRNLKSTTPFATARSVTVVSLACTINTISPPANSIVIAHVNALNNTTFEWSGTAGLVEDFDSGGPSVYRHSGASRKFNAGATTPTIIATASGSWSGPQMSVACWQ